MISTRRLVDSDEEQGVLEEILERSKPSLVNSERNDLHYLLSTPFRYPPLDFGSRFGDPMRRGLWYGSLEIETAFAERAFYAFLFRDGSTADLGITVVPLTAFQASVRTDRCADLTTAPFKDFESEISSKTSYSHSQPLGSILRDKGAEVIQFFSARALDRGINIAVADKNAFAKSKPTASTSWFGICNDETFELKANGYQPLKLLRPNFKRSNFHL